MLDRKKLGALVVSCAIVLNCATGCSQSEAGTAGQSNESGGNTVQTLTNISNEAVLRTPATIDLSTAGTITLSGGSAASDASGVSIDGSVITITAGGVYAVSGTLNDGRIIVNAPDKEVTVALNGADITCSYGSPIYIYKAKTATVHLVESTKNTLTDGESYTFADSLSSAVDEEPNACLYSKADLVLEGAGGLTVHANYNNGITSKDTLQIYDLTLNVTAANHGINGKDSNAIDSASICVECGGDAIRSTNDTDETLGWISVSNSTLDLTAGEDGIQGETSVTVGSGSYTITSGGGSAVTPTEDVSAKGIKATTDLTLAGGIYRMDCSDDALHANSTITVQGGIYTVSSGDDAFHADEDLLVQGGELNILTCYEGLEAANIDVVGGNIQIVSTDDGINAGGGTDQSGFGGHGMKTQFGSSGSNYAINISGGDILIKAQGDGVDSNGTITMTGGSLQVFSTGRADGALDYETDFTLEGGTLLSCDIGGMTSTPRDPVQYTVYLNFGTTLEAGTYVSISNETQSFLFCLPTVAANLLFSSPDLKQGDTYTISYGGTYDGETVDGICSGGTYTGGTELTSITITDLLTTYGQSGMGSGFGGGMGGNHGGMSGGKGERPGGMTSDGTAPEIPADGTIPELPSDGERPELPVDGEMPQMPEDGSTPTGGRPMGGGKSGRGEVPQEHTQMPSAEEDNSNT